MSGLEQQAPRPWYRELWPWLLMLPPVASVLGGAAMVYLATTTSSALVVDDYARIEELTSERFARDLRAVDLGLAARIEFLPAGDGSLRISARLDGDGAGVPPAGLLLALRHVTDPAADRALRLERSGDFYVGRVAAASGRYLVELGPEDRAWRLAGSMPALLGSLDLRPQTGEESRAMPGAQP